VTKLNSHYYKENNNGSDTFVPHYAQSRVMGMLT